MKLQIVRGFPIYAAMWPPMTHLLYTGTGIIKHYFSKSIREMLRG